MSVTEVGSDRFNRSAARVSVEVFRVRDSHEGSVGRRDWAASRERSCNSCRETLTPPGTAPS